MAEGRKPLLVTVLVAALVLVPSAASAVGDLGGPLFGLDTAPSGEILVADAGAGITVVRDDAVRSTIDLPAVTAVSTIGSRSMWAVTGLTGEPGDDTGQALYRVSNGTARHVADLFAFEAADNPDGTTVDSNPYDVASLGGGAALVVDAGGNSLLRVDNQGHIEVVATFPVELVSTENVKSLVGCPNPSPLCALPGELPAQAVPTSVAVGPDGAMYVGELKGFPAPVDASSIWRIEPGTTNADCGTSPACSKVFDGGFTSIVDLAFGPDGNLYVSELDELSWFAVEVLGSGAGGTVNTCDLTSTSCGEVASGIPVHTAITFDQHGELWGTQHALTAGGGEVVPLP